MFIFPVAPVQAPKPTAQLILPSATVAAHHTVNGTLYVTFAEGLHGYQNPASLSYLIPVKVSLARGPASLTRVVYPKGTSMAVGGEDKPVRVYSGKVAIPIVLKAKTKSGRVSLTVDYQQCTESSCYPPDSITVSAELKVKK